MHCRTNPDGLLRQKKVDYMESLEMKYESRLEQLLRHDCAFWQENLKREKLSEKTKK